MALPPPLQQNWEAGPSGTTITNANTTGSSNTALNEVTTVAGGTLAFDSANTFQGHGAFCMKAATGATAGNSFAGWTNAVTGTVTGNWSSRYYLNIGAAGVQARMWAANSASGVISHTHNIPTTRKMFVNDTGGSAAITLTGTAMSTGVWYRIESQCTASTTVGQVALRIYIGDTMTILDQGTSAANMNTGTGLFGNVRYGISGTSVANAGPYYYDDAMLVDGLVWIGPSLKPRPILMQQAVRRAATL